jgi:hypothetical protein
MPQCDYCDKPTTMPFHCQYCGGNFCDEHRLPPNHACVNISAWKKKPLSSVGLSYGKGGGVSATGTGYAETRRGKAAKRGEGLPWLMIMIAVIVIIVLVLAFFVVQGL